MRSQWSRNITDSRYGLAYGVWLFVLWVTLASRSALGSEVFLTKLNIHKIHRVPQIEGAPSIYFQCTQEDRIYLPKVQAKDEDYLWNSHDLLLVSVSPRSCKACAFYEDRRFPLRPDDIYGGSLFQLCEVDFAESGQASKSAQGDFDAVFACEDCKAVPPPVPEPPSPIPVPPPSPSQDRGKGLSGGAIAGLVVAASMASFMMGIALLAAFQMAKARRKAQAEAAFDAALQDSGLGLDDAFEQESGPGLDDAFDQDAEAFHQSLLHPSTWYKLKAGPPEG